MSNLLSVQVDESMIYNGTVRCNVYIRLMNMVVPDNQVLKTMAPHGHEIAVHDLGVMGLNTSRVEL